MEHQLLSYLGQILLAIIASCAPVISYALLAQLKLQNNTYAREILTTAITRGAGVAIDQGVKRGDPLLQSIDKKYPAFEAGMQYVFNTAGPEMKRLGVTQQDIVTKLSSQLALTLHVPTAQALAAASVSVPPKIDAAPSIPVSIFGLKPGQSFPKGI